MRKLPYILAALILTACTKSETQYEPSGEIGFAPVKGNITKAEGTYGPLADTQNLGIWAYWDEDGTVGEVTDITLYNKTYLINDLFVYKNGNWGGAGLGYPWPMNGALVFAGYTTPGETVMGDGKISYDLGEDIMSFIEYENTDEFDLCWFGRTKNSYHYRADGTAVPVNLDHALSWITFAAYGEGLTVGNWTITSMTLNNVANKGSAKCQNGKATWLSTTVAPKTILSTKHTITEGTTSGDKIVGEVLTNNILIPSRNVTLTVSYEYKVNGTTVSETKTVDINPGETWESGKHYTYTLVFKANEILVAPSANNWDTADQNITVE